jgi:periplasmic divalent cation tolerance protein
MQPVMVYITVKDREQARLIARELIGSRLVACVNVLANMTSMYWWEGRVEEADELVVLAKTRDEMMPAVTEAVHRLHDYDCPCIVAWPLTAGHQPFLDWIVRETAEHDKTIKHCNYSLYSP